MPSFDGKKLTSETRVRKRNQCRLVVTLELEVSPDGLATLPRWAQDAADYVKAILSGNPNIADCLAEEFNQGHTKVTEVKLEALK